MYGVSHYAIDILQWGFSFALIMSKPMYEVEKMP